MGTVAYFAESGAAPRKDAVPQAHLPPCVKGEDAASAVIWPAKYQRVCAGEH